MDENISGRIAQIMDIYDHENSVEWLPEYLGQRGIKDTEWINRVGSERPDAIVLAGDSRILKIPQEREALKRANLMFGVMTAKFENLQFRDQVLGMIKAWDIILSKLKKYRHNQVFEVVAKKKGNPVIQDIGKTSEL